MRVVLAAAAGLALIGVGEFCLWRGMKPVAGGLIGSGIAALYVAVFGAYNFYHLVGPTTAFVFYLGVTCSSVAIAIAARSLPLAVLGLIGGYCTPLALNTGTNQQIALLTYVLLLDVGFLAIAIARGWHSLIPLAWAGTLVLFGGWAARFCEPMAMWRTWLFLSAFYVVFHGGVVIGARRARGVVDRLSSTVVYADNAVFFVATYLMWHERLPGALGAFAVSLGGLQWLIAWRGMPDPAGRLVRIACWIGGAAMLAMAAPLQFDRYLVSISWCVQAAATIAFCRKFEDLWLRVKGVAVWGAAVTHLFVFDLHDSALAQQFFEGEHFFLSTAILLFLLAWLTSVVSAFLLLVRRIPTPDDLVVAGVLVWVGSLLLLWTTAHFWDRYVATLCWGGLASAYWLVARQAQGAVWVARALTGAAAAKFVSWDTLGTDRLARAGVGLVGVNRAVLAGLATSAVAYFGRRREPEPSLTDSGERQSATSGDILAWVALILVTWTGTFEILRAFAVDDGIRTQFRQPEMVRGPAVTIFWCLEAAVLWAFMRPQWRNVQVFTLVLTGLAVFKFVVLDTMGLMASGDWQAVQGIAFNAPCWSGFFCIALALWTYFRLGQVQRMGPSAFAADRVLETTLLAFAFLVTWLPTYEIARVFRFEPFRERFADPRFAMHLSLSVLWGLNATALLIAGFVRRRPILRYSALGLYIVTVIKVFLYDLAALQTLYRIVSFLILGVLLLFASILYQKMSGRISDKGAG